MEYLQQVISRYHITVNKTQTSFFKPNNYNSNNTNNYTNNIKTNDAADDDNGSGGPSGCADDDN